jgi:release factor glutamine methyltransferase
LPERPFAGAAGLQGYSAAEVDVSAGAWTVSQVLQWTARYLDDHGSADPRLEAELLLAHTLGLSRLDLYVHHDQRLAPEESELFKAHARRRAAGEPVQYILGEVAFRHLVLRVTPDVLIPRPETERLVDEVLDWVAAAGLEAPRVLDVGTGSGAIALACLQEIPGATALATDLFETALRVAAENAAAAGLAERLELRRGDLFEPLRPDETFDVIAANLPYVSTEELPGLPREVRDYEPEQALFAGASGTEPTARLVAGAPARLRPGGLLVCEIAPAQAEHFRRSVEATPGLRYIAGYRDHAGRERGFLATRVPPPT